MLGLTIVISIGDAADDRLRDDLLGENVLHVPVTSTTFWLKLTSDLLDRS
jgi:hypothetical protein